ALPSVTGTCRRSISSVSASVRRDLGGEGSRFVYRLPVEHLDGAHLWLRACGRTWAEHFKEVHIALGTYKGIVGMWKEVITSLRNLAGNDKTGRLDLAGMEKTIVTAQENINKHRCEFGEKLDALWSREMP